MLLAPLSLHLTDATGNANVPQTQANLIKLYYNLGRELEAHPEAKERYAGVLRSKTVVAVGEDEPIGGKKHTATYFVSTTIDARYKLVSLVQPACSPLHRRAPLTSS